MVYTFVEYDWGYAEDGFSKLRGRKEPEVQGGTSSPQQTGTWGQSSGRIALLSSFVASDMWIDNDDGLEATFDNMINRQCYCHLWNYDCIFNETQDLTLNYIRNNQTESESAPASLHISNAATNEDSFAASSSSKSFIDRWWLKFGCWERISHLQAALPNYDWVLYGDIDFLIMDLTKPIESFVKEFDLYGKDAHVLLPADNQEDAPNEFSSFALLIRNSPFGFKLLENWRNFALGICPMGNFASDDQKYEWNHSDQPGLWYALMKTHMDFAPNSVLPPSIVRCDNTTGFIDDKDTGPTLGFKDYFIKNGVKAGNYGEKLGNLPDDQKIIFGKTDGESSHSGLGVADTGVNSRTMKFVFGKHEKKQYQEWDDGPKRELDLCKKRHACFARLDEHLKIELGCGDEK
jgi:hypothetical protein